MVKKIHYCWFGGKPLPKLAKKCIKSWKKYLPDFEIIEWNEKNFDVNCCTFVKEAYKNKKWAFVSDYARVKALYDYGGIYFDTDMEITKNINFLFENEMFLGKEDSGYIAAGVIGVKTPGLKYINEMLNFYNSQENFNVNNLFEYAIPKIITNILNKYDSKLISEIEIYDNSVFVYPSDYFYPINYDYSNKNYTKNTCMIHYYNATWVPKKEKITIFLYRNFGKKLVSSILNKYYNLKYRIGTFKRIYIDYEKRMSTLEQTVLKCNNDYIVVHNPNWLGVSNATRDLFESTLELNDIHIEKEINRVARIINNSKIKTIIFSGMAKNWDRLVQEIRKLNKDVTIKVLWHGSNALLVENTDYYVFMNVLSMLKSNCINEIGFVKESLYEFFKLKGYNVKFVMNTTNIANEEYIQRSNTEKRHVNIGLYSSLDRWVKNTYNQVSAVSLIDNAILDCVPMSPKVEKFAKELDIKYTSASGNVSRKELFSRMAKNDINLYVTFTECSPMIPLESLELGVPCITGDNHHYFGGTKLRDYLIVNKEDNIIEIYNKILLCIENKDEILDLYKKWKVEYDKKSKESVQNFLNN